MPSAKEIRAQVAHESELRARLAVPAFAGGFLYFISSIIVTTTLNAAPTVGLVQGIEPALRGEANPAISPRAPEVKYISSHALALIAGSTIKALSLGALVLVLLLLVDATRFRRPQTWSAARPLVLIGGVALAVVTLLHQIVSAIQAHNFAVGHDLTNASVEHALTQGTLNVGSQYLDLLAALALTAGMIGVCVNAIRVGLVTRWMGVLGIFAAILIFVPIGGATLEIIPAFWLLAMGILYMGRWPNGDPQAWEAGESRPWPTNAERRAEREQQAGGKGDAGKGRSAKPAKSKPATARSGSSGRAGIRGRRGVRGCACLRHERRPSPGHGDSRRPGGPLIAQAPPQAPRPRLAAVAAGALDAELAALLEVQKFEPPEAFREHALLKDPSVYERAARDPLAWWEAQARELDWSQPWTRVLDDDTPPFYKWFTGGTLNASYNCLDRHVLAGRGDRVALHWRGEDGQERDLTYAELLAEVKLLARALKDQGIRKGDVVGIYLPMIPEVVVAMLACARIGAPHNVVFGGFSAEAVRERMEFSEARLLITVNAAARKGKIAPVKDRVDEVMGDLATLERIIVVRSKGAPCQMQAGRDVFYDEILAAAAQAGSDYPAEPLDAEHPLFILYTSGSTAKPKGILHTTGGYLTCVAATHRYVFDLRAGGHPNPDVYWCAADVGWVTGHSYIVYGPLANGATSVMWEGAPDYPHKGIWWELVERYGVTILYCAPTAIRACIKWGPQWPGKYDLDSLRLLGSVGEPINPKAWLWYHKVIGAERCPIVNTWWQTETGAIMITPLPGITATKPGSATQPFPGVEAAVLSESSGEPIENGQGLLVLTRPWPSMLRTLYKEPERFIDTYFKRFGKETYLVGDAARRDSDGYLWVIGRIDDVVNVSGHRLSTAEIESAIVAHPDVAEAAVIGQHDEDTGQAIVAFVTLQGDLAGDEQTAEGVRATVAERIGKFARPKRIIWTDDLPKTRSGKIMRRLLRDIAEGRALGDVTTLRDPAVTEQLQERVRELQAQED